MGPNIHNPGLQAKVAKLGTPSVQGSDKISALCLKSKKNLNK